MPSQPGRGAAAVLKLSPDGVAGNGAILDTKSPLVLEGLELHRPGGESKGPGAPAVVRTHQSPLQVAHCRFVVKGESNTPLVACPADVTARNCAFEGAPGADCALRVPPAGR